MPWIPREEIERLRKIDLLAYLRQCEPWELKKVSGSEYRMKSHDSISISHGLWHRWSRGSLGGKSALDYLIKVKGMDFLEAAEVLRKSRLMPDAMPARRKFSSSFQLPQENETQEKVYRYLCRERGIDEEIFYDFLQRGKFMKKRYSIWRSLLDLQKTAGRLTLHFAAQGRIALSERLKAAGKSAAFAKSGRTDRLCIFLKAPSICSLSYL